MPSLYKAAAAVVRREIRRSHVASSQGRSSISLVETMAGGRKVGNAAALVAVLMVAVAVTAAGGMKICGVDRTAVDACRSYCAVGSAEASPSKACCDKVRPAQWDCLCKFKGSLPDDIDGARVMDLQHKCTCDYPSATCGGAN
jgi:hypothetical protein